MKRRGFTLIELILVIAILGILAVSALPRFMDFTGKAKESARDGVVGSVRAGIALYKANDMVQNGGSGSYPASGGLDANAVGACVTCFSGVLANGVSDSSWNKDTANNYTFNDGTNTSTFVYSNATGTFAE